MVRTLFRTAFMGMMAVAGLFLLFFVLKIFFFFLIVGFFATKIGRYARRRHAMAGYDYTAPHNWQQRFHQGPENILGYAPYTPGFHANAPRQQPQQPTAIIEISR